MENKLINLVILLKTPTCKLYGIESVSGFHYFRRRGSTGCVWVMTELTTRKWRAVVSLMTQILYNKDKCKYSNPLPGGTGGYNSRWSRTESSRTSQSSRIAPLCLDKTIDWHLRHGDLRMSPRAPRWQESHLTALQWLYGNHVVWSHNLPETVTELYPLSYWCTI